MNSSKIDVGVLYVEDDELTRGMMQELLSDYVEPLYCAEDGLAGWELFKKHKPSIVVTDMRMPRMNGLEMVAEIRALAPETKVIITSAYSDSEYLLQAIEQGVDRFSIKPVDIQKLVSDLREFEHTQKIEREFRETKRLMQQYKKAIDVSTVVTTTDAKGVITYVNDEFCRVMGFERSELIGKNHNVVRHPSVEKAFYKDMWDTLSSHLVWRGRIHNKRKDGQSIYVDTAIVPIVNEKGEVIEYISFQHDVTEQIKQQDELEKMRLKNTEESIDKALNIGLTTLVSHMPVMAASSDEEGRIIQMSEAMVEFFDGDGSKGLRDAVEAGNADLCCLLESAVTGACAVGGLDEIFMMADDFAPYQLELTSSSGETRTVELRYQSLSIDGALRYIIYLLGHMAEA